MECEHNFISSEEATDVPSRSLPHRCKMMYGREYF